METNEVFGRWPGQVTLEVEPSTGFDSADVNDRAFFEDVPLGAAYESLAQPLSLVVTVWH